MHYLSTTVNLEDRLNVREIIDVLEKRFDSFGIDYFNKYKNNTRNILRIIKLFLYKEWGEYKELFKDSYLNSKDCLALTTIASMLAKRKGISTKVASPKKIFRFLHAMLLYQREDKEEVFEIAAKYVDKSYSILSAEEIKTRLYLTKPLFNILSLIPFYKSHAVYLKE